MEIYSGCNTQDGCSWVSRWTVDRTRSIRSWIQLTAHSHARLVRALPNHHHYLSCSLLERAAHTRAEMEREKDLCYTPKIFFSFLLQKNDRYCTECKIIHVYNIAGLPISFFLSFFFNLIYTPDSNIVHTSPLLFRFIDIFYSVWSKL